MERFSESEAHFVEHNRSSEVFSPDSVRNLDQIQQLNQALEEEKQQNLQLQTRVDNLQSERCALVEERDCLQEKQRNLEGDSANVSEQLNKMEKQLAEEKKRADEATSELRDINASEIIQQNNDDRQLREELSLAASNCSFLQEQLQHQGNMLHAKEQEYNQARSHISALERDLTTMTQRVEEEKDIRSRVEIELSSLKERMTNKEEGLEQNLSAYKEKLMKEEEARKQAEAAFSNVQRELKERDSKLLDATKKLRNAEIDREKTKTLRAEDQSTVSQLREENGKIVQQATAREDSLNQQLAEVNSELLKLRDDYERLGDIMRSGDERTKTMEEDAMKHQNELDVLTAQFEHVNKLNKATNEALNQQVKVKDPLCNLAELSIENAESKENLGSFNILIPTGFFSIQVPEKTAQDVIESVLQNLHKVDRRDLGNWVLCFHQNDINKTYWQSEYVIKSMKEYRTCIVGPTKTVTALKGYFYENDGSQKELLGNILKGFIDGDVPGKRRKLEDIRDEERDRRRKTPKPI